MKIYFATDHAGFWLKEKMVPYVKSLGYEVEDCGTESFKIDDDYTDFIPRAVKKVSADPQNSRALIFGGSGQGEAMVANRFPNVRATVYYGEKKPLHRCDLFSCLKNWKRGGNDIITLSREHNDANVLSLGARFVSENEAQKVVKLWLQLKFTGEARHERRIAKIETVTK